MHCTTHNNKISVYRRSDSLAPQFPKPKHALKLHVWAGISRRGATPVVIFEGIMKSVFYVESILEPALLPFLFPDGHRFMQDNDPKHTSHFTQEHMEENNVNWWKIWPPESPDINPIEMVWSLLKTYLRKLDPMQDLSTKDQLKYHIKAFWFHTMTPELCNRYIDHIFKVVPVCIAVCGCATGRIPDRLFREPSSGKSLGYFWNLLQTERIQDQLAVITSEK